MANRRPTRSQVISTLVNAAVLESRTQWNAYAAEVVLHYHDTVAVEDRDVEFHVATTADNHERATRLNTQTVRRILSGEIRMCVDIEESLINALPDPYRDHVLAELLGRDGLILARKPPMPHDVVGQVGAPAELMRRAADAVQAIAPMLADNNAIGPEDQHHFAKALAELHESMGAHLTAAAMITDAMGKLPGAKPSLKVVG